MSLALGIGDAIKRQKLDNTVDTNAASYNVSVTSVAQLKTTNRHIVVFRKDASIDEAVNELRTEFYRKKHSI